MFEPGGQSDKVEVKMVRKCILSNGLPLTEVECGRIVKFAFPNVFRKRSNACWYYYGLRFVEPNKIQKSSKKIKLDTMSKSSSRHTFKNIPAVNDETGHSESHLSNACLMKGNQPVAHSVTNKPCNEKSTKEHDVGRKPKDFKCTGMSSVQQQAALERRTGAVAKQKFKQYKIPLLNLNKDDISDLTHGCLIGEGTFGKCVAGKYKNVPTAFKIFKSSDYRQVHAEADMLLMIPSHPGVAMLIGVLTMELPYLLATKLCLASGKPQTFSKMLEMQRSSEDQSLSTILHLLYHTGAALHHIHLAGVLHNDLKANNVVVEECSGEKRPVLIDFGKACTIQSAKGLWRLNFSAILLCILLQKK